MPYVPATEALNEAFVDVWRLRDQMGATPWRAALVGTPGVRVVLLGWPPGYATVPHVHPHAEEVFLVLQGRAAFSIGNEPERDVGPGQFMLAERGERHGIRVPLDGEPLVLLAAVVPNEDAPDETIE